MAGASRATLPQFDPGDLATGEIIRKLRVLVADLERGQRAAPGPETAPGQWRLAAGAPAPGAGQVGDFALGGRDGAAVIYYKGADGWQPQATIDHDAAADDAGRPTSDNQAIRSLTAGAGIRIRRDDDDLSVALAGPIDGGYFAEPGVSVALTRGLKQNRPLVAAEGEAFLATDTRELFVGVGGGVEPLAIDPAHVTGLLDADGRIAERWVERAGRPAVTVVDSTQDRDKLAAARGDIAVQRPRVGRPAAAFAYDGGRWQCVARATTSVGAGRSLIAGYDADHVYQRSLVAGASVTIAADADTLTLDTPGARLSLTAGEALGGQRVVAARNGQWFHADHHRPDDADRALAVTLVAGAAGADVLAQSDGFMADASWAWTPGAPVYLGAAGVLTQTPPADGFIQIMGHAASAQRIAIMQQTPILTATEV